MRPSTLLLVVFVTACAETAQRPEGQLERTQERPYRAGIRFDPDSTIPGTRIGTLVLDTLIMRNPASGYDADIARFQGEVTLSGATMRHPDADLGSELVCFEADSASAARLPRMIGDERRAWFCLSNTSRAAELIAPPGEIVPARIVVDSFKIVRGSSDEVNSARLVRVP